MSRLSAKIHSIREIRVLSPLLALFLLSSCWPAKINKSLSILQVSIQPAPAQTLQSVSPLFIQNSPNPWQAYTNTNDPLHIALDRNGVIWTGGTGGVTRWDPANQIYQVFTLSAGLPENDITALAISPDDHVWVGTFHGGVASYDGKSWTSYSLNLGETVSSLAIAPDGLIWIGTNKGLSSFDGKINWYSYPRQKHLDNYIHSLALTSSGEVWAGVTGGVIYYDGSKWNIKSLEKGETISAIVEALDKTVWLATNTALIHVDGSQWIEFRLNGSLPAISSLALDRQGQLWLSDGHSTVARFDSIKQLLIKYPIPNVVSLAADPSGALWLGRSQGGLGRFVPQKNSLIIVVAENEPIGNSVLSSAIGLDGSLWIGTDSGVSRFDGHSWQSYTTTDGLLNNTVLAIASAPPGSMWFGSPNGSTVFDGSSWKTFPLQGLSDLVASPAGNVWAIQRQSNLQSLYEWALGGSNLPPLPFTFDVNQHDFLRSIAPGVPAGLWLVSSKGLWYFVGENWIYFNLPSNAVPLSVLQSSHRDVWIYTKGMDLVEVSGSLWDQVGLNNLQSIVLDENGQVEASPRVSPGKVPLNGVTWQSYSLGEDFPGNENVFLMESPADASIWLVAGQRILSLVNGQWIDRSFPMMKNEYGWNTAVMDSRGSLWLTAPLLGGIIQYSP